MLTLFSGLCLKAKNHEQQVLKSFNFKLYFTKGGEFMAEQILTQAESNLETMENFLGTRLVEQIDIFLSEEVGEGQKPKVQRNGTIFLDNSSINLHYKGNTPLLLVQLKEQLAEILINDMLYGNTIKERLKNNREINVPDWYVIGLAKYVAGGIAPDMGWMADYYEGKLKLNLNLTEKAELAEFGHAIFIHICDSFGVNKLRQLLFYTKLSGKTEYAFQYVLNKSLNRVLADWYKLQKSRYLKNNITRLPNDPEPISKRLLVADIKDIKFNEKSTDLNFLKKTINGVELWNYDIENRKSSRVFRFQSVDKNNIYAFARKDNRYFLAVSNGQSAKILVIEKSRIIKTIKLNFSYIHSLKLKGESGLSMLAQMNYQTDVYYLDLTNPDSPTNLTNDNVEEIDFVFDNAGELYTSVFERNHFALLHFKTKKVIHYAGTPIIELNTYKGAYLSYIQRSSVWNYGMVVNPEDTLENFQVTNYNRSITNYDFNPLSNKVMEGVKYGKKNYIVISDASLDRVRIAPADTFEIESEPQVAPLDTSVKRNYAYKFLTGFEYKLSQTSTPQVEPRQDVKAKLKIKWLTAPAYEFKPLFLKIGFTNTTFNSPLFASFYPVRQGLYNGPNIILGCGISDIKKKYFLSGNMRQPLIGRGTDLDFSLITERKNTVYGIDLFNSRYQRELYNQSNRYTISEFKVFVKTKWRPQLTSTFTTGYRQDASIPLSESIENLQLKVIRLQQPFLLGSTEWNMFQHTKLNYSQKLSSVFTANFFKPLSLKGFNTNLFLKIQHDQLFFRLFHLSTRFLIQSSVGQQKTVWLMGGTSNWLRPVYANAPVYNPESVVMFSSMSDFAGLPFNYKAGTSAVLGKLILKFPLNPLLSQQNFNQNILKFLMLRSFANLGTAWFGTNPFSISNPDNRDVIETGNMTITNYVAKNPLLWSWGVGVNTVIFGYELGFDFSTGYNERGKIGKFSYLTVGKEF